ncbi:hypothetical protein ACRAWD_23805 [Caulobacter segnis]
MKPPPGYLGGGGGIVATAIIGPPPAPDSPRGKAERAQFDETRKLVNTPTWSQAIADADLSGKNGMKSFSCAAGVTLSAEATSTLAHMLLRMTDDAAKIYQPAKAAYQRPRPPVGNTAPICVPREAWIETRRLLPSGHGLIGWAWALVIAELVPDKASLILARGKASRRQPHRLRRPLPERRRSRPLSGFGPRHPTARRSGLHERPGQGAGGGGGVEGQGRADGLRRSRPRHEHHMGPQRMVLGQPRMVEVPGDGSAIMPIRRMTDCEARFLRAANAMISGKLQRREAAG